MLGLGLLTAFTLAGMWLLHAGIDPAEEQNTTVSASRHELLGTVRTWGYQLQALDVASAAASRSDLLVIDGDFAGRGGAGRGARDALVRLKRKPDGQRRLVLAYLSIGEAESYRAYWSKRWLTPAATAAKASKATDVLPPTPQPATRMSGSPPAPNDIARQQRWVPGPDAPAWLGEENSEWRGNYHVRFWDETWQRLIVGGETSALERIIAAGFDGVYLDRADAWSRWTTERSTARADMISFIEAISSRARAQSPGFIVVMQNAEELLGNNRLRLAIDAVAKEDLLFGIDGTMKANDEKDVAASVRYLKKAQQSGLPVLIVEYLSDGDEIAKARSRLQDLGFVPSFAPRALDRLGSLE